MDTVAKDTQALLTSIRKNPVYREYKKQEKILGRNPDLMERVNRFRADNFRLQHKDDRDTLLRDAEQLSRESAELRQNPEVNAYLDAELALCRLIQQVCVSITEGIELNIPVI